MEIGLRDWGREDLRAIGTLWQAALREAEPEGIEFRSDAGKRMNDWLLECVRERSRLGIVAEVDGVFAGFILGRVGEWESSPPITRVRRMGLIDVVCVVPASRRQGVATRLIAEALRRMKARGAVRIETHWLAGDEPATRMWTKLGFRPSLQRGGQPTQGP